MKNAKLEIVVNTRDKYISTEEKPNFYQLIFFLILRFKDLNPRQLNLDIVLRYYKMNQAVYHVSRAASVKNFHN